MNSSQKRSNRRSRRHFLNTSLLAAVGLLAACRPAGEIASPAAPTAAPLPTHTPPPAQTPTVEQTVQVLAEGLDFPEGPAFDPQGDLWCTELGKGNLIHLVNGKVNRLPVSGKPNSLAFDRLGRAWICDSSRNSIRRLEIHTGQWETLLDSVDGQPLHTPNDLAFDDQNNLVFTCTNYDSTDKTGFIVCLRPDGSAHKIADGWNRPNGLDFVEGGKALVAADTFTKTLYKGAWDAAQAAWSDPQPWVKVGGQEGPDGMAPGADGLLYQAIYGDGVVRVVDVTAGKVTAELKLPGRNPTNCVVDPTGKLGLVVTESETGRLLSLPWVKPGAAIFGGPAA